MMVRSFDKRLEALFKVESELLEKQLMNVISYCLRDNENAYTMQEDGSYIAKTPQGDEPVFNVHKEFYNLDPEEVLQVELVK